MGYEIERFVSDLNGHLVCEICDQVFENPKMLSSCEHIFCFGCIESKIINESKCPLDGKPIDSSHVEDPPKHLIQYLSALKIKCDFREFGCMEVISLPRLLLHRLNCHFHPERRAKCSNCGFEAERIRLKEHNCISVLNARLNQMSQRIEEMERFHATEISSLKCQMQRRSNFHHPWINEQTRPVDRQMISFSCIGDTESGTHEIIFIQTSDLTLQCEASVATKVDQIKYNASVIANHCTTDFSLYCNGIRLDDHKHISDYNIRNGTICHLLPNQVFVTFDCPEIKRVLSFSVNTWDTIEAIIRQLNDQIEKVIPEQLFLYLCQCSCSLYFNDTKLERSYPLANYDVFAIKRLKYCT